MSSSGTVTSGPTSSTTSSSGSTSPGTTAAATSSTGQDTTGPATVGATTGIRESSSSTTGRRLQCQAQTFPEAWPDGTACPEAPLTVHALTDDTVILRQSLCTSFEGPFMYLLFGEDRVLLEDTGDGGVPIAQTVYDVIDQWLRARGKTSIELVVVNSHAHGDHTAGNSQFAGQPNTTVVGPGVAAVSQFFGIDDWPTQTVAFDLGDRVVDVIPIPGHESSHVALFDRRQGLLLTGDTLYPGRLYIADFDAYEQSLERLVAFAGEDEVCAVLGTHIEMTERPGVDFEFGATQHPGERALELEYAHVVELRDSVVAMPSPMLEVHDDFIIYPL